MSDEYEVEAVLEARVEKKRGKKAVWKYHVKWKGYGHGENTWEPYESFQSGSQDMLARFWKSVDAKGRDISDPNRFPNGEAFLPIQHTTPDTIVERGPPPHKEAQPPATPSPEPVEQSGPSGSRRARPRKRRQRSPSPDTDRPLSKRSRKAPSDAGFSSAKASGSKRSPRGRPSPSLKLPSASKRKASAHESSKKPHKESSSEAADSEAEVSRDYLATPSGSTSVEMTVPDASPDEDSFTSSPMANDDDDLFGDSQDLPAPSPLSHRPRIAQSRVKLVDDPNFGGIDGAISVKARFLRRDPPPAPGAATMVVANGSAPISASVSAPIPKAGPSKNLSSRKSSLLTFEKGALKTLKRTRAPLVIRPARPAASLHGPNVVTNVGVQDKPKNVEDVDHPATGEELLRLAGYNEEDAAALPDFEDDPLPELEISEAAQNVPLPQSLIKATPTLLPENSRPASTAAKSVWERPTIFGPLGLGADALPLEAPLKSDPPLRPAFLLNLDYSIAISIVLKDISPALPEVPSLGAIVSRGARGPSGKFYKDQSALTVLDTLRSEGSAARVSLDLDADEKQQKSFEKFASRLHTGELFIAMAGAEVLAFCSAENQSFGQRLNVPPALLGLSGSVLVSLVVIEDHSAYADAAVQVDAVRWS